MSKYMYVGILLLVAVLCFSVFSNAQQKFKIGYSSESFGTAFSMSLVNGAVETAKALGIDLIVMDSQHSVENQVKHVENFVAQKCDLIIIHPNNAKVLGLKAQWAQSMGIPVISISMKLDPPSVGLVEFPWVDAGNAVTEALAKAIGYKGKVVMIQGMPGSSSKAERDASMELILKKYPDIELLDKKGDNWDRVVGLTIMSSFLQAYPQIDGVFAQSDDIAVGAIQAIKAAGRKGIFVVGMDGPKENVDLIRSGDQYATAGVEPSELGKQAIYLANFILTQEDKNLWKKMNGVVTVEFTIINPENVEEFTGF